MKNLVSTYVDQFRQDRQKQLKLLAVLAALAVVVAGVVFWQLHNTGVAMTNEVFCGQEEHVHDDGCYEQVLICNNEEEDHVHDDSCYETVLTCQIPEHIHTVECLMDETADVETAAVWEETLPELTDVWADNVVAIAGSQVGYTESTANFQLADDGETHMGYTRYGAWYGNEYGDWDAMFVAFCLNYAGVPESEFAESSGAYALAVQLEESGLYVDTAEFTPVAGDLIFFDDDEDGAADRVGIVTAVGENVMTVVEGNVDGAVIENTYFADDDTILSYGILPEQEGVDNTETGNGVLTYLATDGGVTVKANAPADALPAGAELSVSLLDESSKDYAEAAEAVGTGGGNGFAVLDICFLLDGEEIEPSGPVTVNMNISGLLPENAEDIVIHHLEETPVGVDPEIVTTLSGADQANAIEFEVECFSKFTIEWNDGTGDSITVHVFNMKGAGIEEVLDTEYTHDGGDILIADIVNHLNGTVSSSHYEYATVYYEMAAFGAGYEASTVGAEENSVTEISKADTTYFVTLEDGSVATISDPYTIDIHLYYSIPTVTITADNEHGGDGPITLTAVDEFFKGLNEPDSETLYDWALSDDSVGTLSWNNNNAEAEFTWAADTEVGTSVTIGVTMTNTYFDDNGESITESASDTYTLTYGEQAVTITVYTSDGTTAQENAHVALVDDSGNTVATGITGSDGTVTLYAIPGSYTVGSTYVAVTSTVGPGTTTRYTGDSTIVIPEEENEENVESVTLDSGIASTDINGSTDVSYGDWGQGSPYYYEHIDVKAAIAEAAGANEVFSDLDSVYVYDKYGNLIYSSDDLIANEGTGDYNCAFDLNGAEDVHSIVVSSEDMIVITYEVIVTNDDGTTETKTYTVTLSDSNYYPADEYYSYNDVNAWQLYDVIYNANITEDDWDTALANGTLETLLGDNYNGNGIPIGGLSYIRVADYLCDSRQTAQAGLDFVIDVTAVDITSWDFTIAKTFTGVSGEEAPEDVFTFELYEVESPAEDTWILPAGSAAIASGSTTEWTRADDGTTWSSDIQMTTDPYETDASQVVYYYILKEADTGYTESNVDAYGIQVMITIDSETGAPSVASVSYTALTLTESGEDGSSYSGGELVPLTEITDEDGNSLYVLPFVNTYAADCSVDIYKYTEDYTNAIWTSTTSTEGNPNATDTYYLRYSTTNENGEAVYYYAIGSGSGTSEDDPFVVTDWTTDQYAEGVISVSVAANAGVTYYFAGEMGTEDVYFEFTGTTTEINEPIAVVEGTNMAGLEGAEFRLTGIEDETTGTSSVAWFSVSTEDDLTVYTFVGWDLSETEGYTDVITSGTDGYIHIIDIPAGEYTLTETSSPDGYNRIIGSVTFTVDSDGDLQIVDDESGRASVIETEDGLALAVENVAGSGLPNTGGIGTWIYTVTGLLLIGGAASLFVYRKRRGVES